jgi:hypothetical protein
MAFGRDLEEVDISSAKGESTVFRRGCDRGVRLFVGSGEQPLQDCKFLGLGSVICRSIVVNRAAGTVV